MLFVGKVSSQTLQMRVECVWQANKDDKGFMRTSLREGEGVSPTPFNY